MKTVIFDMDGLMFDTEIFWIKYSKQSALKQKIILSDEVIKSCMGTTKKRMKKILFDNYGKFLKFDEFYNYYYSLIINYIKTEGTPLKKGLIELLNYLINNDYQLAIASSSERERILFYLKKANIDANIFDEIVSGHEVKNGKPKPDIFIKTCDLLKKSPKECIVLEDSNNGIKSAFNAGCIPILIPDCDEIKKETLKMAKHKINSLLELIPLLEKINN